MQTLDGFLRIHHKSDCFCCFLLVEMDVGSSLNKGWRWLLLLGELAANADHWYGEMRRDRGAVMLVWVEKAAVGETDLAVSPVKLCRW